jgi:hypothetical protein
MTGGCAFLPDNSVTADAKLAVKVALKSYGDVYQPLVISYGRLPVCPAPVPMLCHDRAVFADLAKADAAVTASIGAAEAVMRGDVVDTNNYLQKVMTAIEAAKVKIAATGLLRSKEN